MHDPMHVIFDLLRPWPNRSRRSRRRQEPNPRRRHRQLGPINVRAAEFRCAHCDDGKVPDPAPSYIDTYPGDDCPECLGRGFNRTSLRGRLPYLSMHFWRFGDREWYFPTLITLWHVDPEADGSDSSCRNRYRRRWREAHADGDGLRKWFWGKAMRHYDKWHVHHWSVQVRVWQDFNRWAWSRCAACGGRFKWSEAPVSSGWHGTGPRWRQPEEDVRHMACAGAVGDGEKAAA